MFRTAFLRNGIQTDTQQQAKHAAPVKTFTISTKPTTSVPVWRAPAGSDSSQQQSSFPPSSMRGENCGSTGPFWLHEREGRGEIKLTPINSALPEEAGAGVFLRRLSIGTHALLTPSRVRYRCADHLDRAHATSSLRTKKVSAKFLFFCRQRGSTFANELPCPNHTKLLLCKPYLFRARLPSASHNVHVFRHFALFSFF
jgi:hypothetical protein